MDAKLQDLAFACLPKEAREEIRKDYNSYNSSYSVDFNAGYAEALETYFGYHNLTSDTEPEGVVFIIPVEQVRETYAYNEQILKYDPGHKGALMLQSYLLQTFGDKCLPDKTLEEKAKEIVNTIKEDIENPIQMPETMLNPQPSIKVEPKFHNGDLVICLTDGQVYEVEGKTGKHHYALKGSCYDAHEDNLEPYPEPETKDNMEEKELNFCELLKGCEGEDFYCPAYGSVIFDSICDYTICTHIEHNKNDRLIFNLNGKFLYHKDGVCQFYPSRALYEKYPLDAYSAWMEWKSERTPKRWRAEKGEHYWRIVFDKDFDNYIADSVDVRDSIDNACYEVGNYFKDEQTAQQAAEAVREFLIKFHEKNTKQ